LIFWKKRNCFCNNGLLGAGEALNSHQGQPKN
jgi:hypothetical protein